MKLLSYRMLFVVIGLSSIWTVLAIRLVHLQAFEHADLQLREQRQKSHVEVLPARPGDIVDRHGHLLAMTITRPSLFLDPARIDNPREVADLLAELMDLDAEQLYKRITARADRRFLWVRRRISDALADQVRQLGLKHGTWGFRDEHSREYPQGPLAAHVLGIRDIDGLGRGGVEQSLDCVLRGCDGTRTLIRDARGAVVDVQTDDLEPPKHGETVVLTIDAVIQLHTERALDRAVGLWQPEAVCAIVMEPQSGEILAMASRPVFDPSNLAGTPAAAWKNVAVSAVYEPGSTLKPCIMAWALQSGLVRPDEEFHCEWGSYRMGSRVLHDHHAYGRLSASDILIRSSNIGMAKIGERLGNARLHDAVMAFGFGRRTGIEVPGELSGIVRAPEDWDDYSTGSIPMGHEISVTPIQLITAHASLAAGGCMINPHIVRRDDRMNPSPRSEVADHASGSSVTSKTVSPSIADWLVQVPMTEVVRRGSSRRAAVEGYSVFGKSGTSQTFDPEAGRYSTKRPVCSFICGAPAERPELLVLVVVDRPGVGSSHFGSTVAAPVAGEILRQSLIHSRR